MHMALHECDSAADQIRRIVRHRLRPHFRDWSRCNSTAELRRHPRYQELEPLIRRVLNSAEAGHYCRSVAPPKSSYRFLAWNLERGIRLDGQIEALRTHQYLASADVLLLTETDIGMARSANRDVARTLARELGFHYAFAPCYLNLTKGAGEELEAEGENELGLHGNALLSRYPIRNVRSIPLANGIDKMSGREKRIGRQVAVAAEIVFPNFAATAVCVHLDANSTQKHRRDQMRTVLDAVPASGAVVVGGDWNTTTYNSATAFHAIMGYWLRVLMGVDNVIRNHYLHPYRRFERQLFELLESRGFDWRHANRLGEYTVFYDFHSSRTYKGLSEWVPRWCFPFIRWALRNHNGRCPLKLDWFATRAVRAANPTVLHDLHSGGRPPLSDHDPIGLDILL